MLLYAFTIPFARRMAKPLRRFALGLPARSPLKTGPRSGFPGAPALLIGKASLGSPIRGAVTVAEGLTPFSKATIDGTTTTPLTIERDWCRDVVRLTLMEV